MSCINDDTSSDNANKVNVGDNLPNFSVTSNDGAIYSNQSLLGHIGVIVFFYTPCTDCKQALPILNDVYEANKDNAAFRWICIGRSESVDDVTSYWESHHFTLPYSVQSDRNVYSLFANSGIPRIYITNPSGVVCAVYDDSSPLVREEFESTLHTIYTSSFTY